MDKMSFKQESEPSNACDKGYISPAVLGISSGSYGAKLPVNMNSKEKNDLLKNLEAWRQARKEKLVKTVLMKGQAFHSSKSTKLNEPRGKFKMTDADNNHSDGKQNVFDRLYTNSKQIITKEIEGKNEKNRPKEVENIKTSPGLNYNGKVRIPKPVLSNKIDIPEEIPDTLKRVESLAPEEENIGYEESEITSGKECNTNWFVGSCKENEMKQETLSIVEESFLSSNEAKPCISTASFTVEEVTDTDDELKRKEGQSSMANESQNNATGTSTMKSAVKIPVGPYNRKKPHLRRSISMIFRKNLGKYRPVIHRTQSECFLKDDIVKGKVNDKHNGNKSSKDTEHLLGEKSKTGQISHSSYEKQEEILGQSDVCVEQFVQNQEEKKETIERDDSCIGEYVLIQEGKGEELEHKLIINDENNSEHEIKSENAACASFDFEKEETDDKEKEKEFIENNRNIEKSIKEIYKKPIEPIEKEKIEDIENISDIDANEPDGKIMNQCDDNLETENLPKDNDKTSYLNEAKRNLCLPKTEATAPSAFHLREKLEGWLKENGHSVDKYKHLSCFGLNTNRTLRELHRNEEKLDDSCNTSFSFSPQKQSATLVIDVSEKENFSPLADIEVVDQKVVEEWLNDLYRLITHLNYPRDRCEEWLSAISKKFENCAQLPIYWECVAAISCGGSSDTSLKESQRDSVDEDDVRAKSLAELLSNLSIGEATCQVTPKSVKGLSADNIFNSKSVKFAIREKEVKEQDPSLGTEAKRKVLVATPVRRSTRIQTPDKTNVVMSLNSLDPELRRSISFKPNKAFLNN